MSSRVPARVQRHRQADAARRRVTTRGKRVPRPPRPPAPPKRRRPRWQKSAAVTGLSVLIGGLCFAVGQIAWGLGSVAGAGLAAGASYIQYRSELAQVKATGKPIEDPKAKPRGRAGAPLQPGDPKPVDLDKSRTQQASATARANPKAQHGPPGHEATCKAKTPQACPYWRKANPGRVKKSTSTRTTRKS